MARRRRSIEQVYPDRRAREAADKAVDDLSLDATMLMYIILWEETYLANGGKVNL